MPMILFLTMLLLTPFELCCFGDIRLLSVVLVVVHGRAEMRFASVLDGQPDALEVVLAQDLVARRILSVCLTLGAV